MAVIFKFDGQITVTVPYGELPPGLLGRDAEAIREWVQAWLRDNAPAISLVPERVYLPEFTGGGYD